MPKKRAIELPAGDIERHPCVDEDDEWEVRTEYPRRLPPKSEDFKRRPKMNKRQSRHVAQYSEAT